MTMTMRSNVPTVAALLLGYALMQAGNTLQGTLLGVRGSLENFTSAQVGAVGAAFWIGVVLGSLRAGWFIMRVGHARAFAALAAVASTVPLLHLLVVDPLAWMVARAITGFCFAGLFMVVESWLSATATPGTRGRTCSLYGMTGLVAGVSGQMLLPLGDPSGFGLFGVVAVIIGMALVPTALTRTGPPGRAAGGTRIDLKGLHASSPFGVLAAVLCGITTGSFYALGPVFARAHGLDASGIAIFMACGTLGGFAMIWPLGWLSDRIDRRVVIIGMASIAATILFGFAILVPERPAAWVVYLCVAILGGSVIPTYSIVAAHVNDTVRSGGFVAASGGLLILHGAGSALGPVASGLAMGLFGTPGLIYTIIAAQAAMALWGTYRIRCRPAPLEGGKAVFRPAPVVPVGTGLAAGYRAPRRPPVADAAFHQPGAGSRIAPACRT
ncbi:MFS transporter [Microvirga massiliensis]|uniref:MFS transporter n=1 Tax=Microvirga massiliensis TaxID=1033741 RepID=UPI0007C78D0D|nr:MFS transporter [Microvirga massiliensis]